MAQKKNKKNNKKNSEEQKNPNNFYLPEKTKRWIWGIILVLLALVVLFSFFNLSGIVGKGLFKSLSFLIGKIIFLLPPILIIAALVFFRTPYQEFSFPLLLASLLLITSLTGLAGGLSKIPQFTDLADAKSYGGVLGYLLSLSLFKLFGLWVTQIIFFGFFLVGIIIFWHLLKKPAVADKETLEKKPKTSFLKKIFTPTFKIKEIEPGAPPIQGAAGPEKEVSELAVLPAKIPLAGQLKYELPPLDLLEADRGEPSSGDTRANSAIIKKTLQNFDIPVEMSEINIGPTVTQYTLKPAEGVKLSKITTLSNDLSLALAAHPLRIEAPIPGRSLVGIEVPNKVRARVRLRNLLSHPNYQNSPSSLTIALGRDVSGNPVYADLSRMPHLLVAGSTGTGKTIFLNNLLLSLLYKNSPEILRLILTDPKRVEFPVYNELPHLLAPVIYNANLTCNALKWLIGEMERRFDVLSGAGARDIVAYNEMINKQGNQPLMPYIVLIIDELADLMAAKGREIEGEIVRIAQMARAVGIHLVVATQRPSVEVITGLIKANITTRVTFQVASQVDSRTVLDMAGAEKLLGLGDMLFISAEIAKPKRIQSPFVSEKEVRKVVNFITSKARAPEMKVKEEILGNNLAEDLEKSLEAPASETETFYGGDDPLYEEAKRVVIEAKKASASLLQRRLRVGYARGARLLDILEEKGVVGPGEGAKPREVFLKNEKENEITKDKEENSEEWQQV